VDGKTASVGELYGALADRDIKVPNGFALTAQAYRDALSGAHAWGKLHGLLDGLDKQQVKLLHKAAVAAREIVYAATGTAVLRSPALCRLHASARYVELRTVVSLSGLSEFSQHGSRVTP
jgi:phosphoenolpyruvate synthase/pyruvate phosphate dikinase